MASWDQDQRIDVFYVSASGTLAHTYSDTAGLAFSSDDWGKPTGYNIYGQVGVASWGPLRVDVFVLGKTTPLSSTDPGNNSLFHRYWADGFFSAWQLVGPAPYVENALFTSSPDDVGVTAVSWSNGIGNSTRIDVFAAKTVNALAHWYSTDGINFGLDQWPTQSAGLAVPDVTSWGEQRLDIFYAPTSPGTVGVRHIFWDHGSFGEDNWGTSCSLSGPQTGAAAYGNYWLATSRACEPSGPTTNAFRAWQNGNSAWQSLSPGFQLSGSNFPFARFGDGATVVLKPQ